MDHTRKRLICSVFFVRLLLAALVLLCLTWPWLLKLLIQSRAPDLARAYPLLLAVLYAATLLTAVILFSLRRLLERIQRTEVFVPGNVGLLHRISMGTLLLALIFALGGLCYFGFWPVSIGCLFTGLILQVVADVFAQAVALQQENDYTI